MKRTEATTKESEMEMTSCYSMKLWCFTYDHPEHFVNSQWSIPWQMFILYRLLIAAYLIAMTVLPFLYAYGGGILAWAFLPYWTNAAFVMTSIFALVSAIHVHFVVLAGQRGNRNPFIEETEKKSSPSEKEPLQAKSEDPVNYAQVFLPPLPGYLKCYWALRNISYNMCLVESFLFWTLIYDYSSAPPLLITNQHITNSLLAILDCFISATPVRLLHVWQPMLFALVYILFSIIFWLVTGLTRVELFDVHIINYTTHPYLSVIVLFVIVALMQPTFQFVLVCFSDFRQFIYQQTPKSKCSTS